MAAPELTQRVRAWQREGEQLEFRGRRIHARVRAGDDPPLVFLHGFPSSSYDWHGVLAERWPNATLAFDFLGFGLSDKPADHTYTLAWQADLTEELVGRLLPGRAVFLVAHDMGTSVATELMARELDRKARIEAPGALLFNGSILLERASPTIGQKLLRTRLGPAFARLTTAPAFRRQLGAVFSPKHPLTREEAEDQWALIRWNGGSRIAHRLIHYMDERERLTDRWHGAFRDWPGKLALAWGLRDPVATPAVLAGLRELRDAPVTELRELGHYPQIEDAGAMAAAIRAALP